MRSDSERCLNPGASLSSYRCAATADDCSARCNSCQLLVSVFSEWQHTLQSSAKAMNSDTELAAARVAMDAAEVLLAAQVEPK